MKIGFFGFIGTGKTTAIEYLKREYNFQILNLDEISKIVLNEEDTISFIRNSIPEAYNIKSKSIDRSKLRTILFTSKRKNKLFARFVWPQIGLITNTILEQIPPTKRVAVEGALLPILEPKLDKIILLETKNKKIVFERVKKRDHRDILETKKLLKIQKSWIKNANFDALIENDSTIENLYLKIDQLMSKYGIEKGH